MPGLTAKVFRTYNASFTFQDQLNILTPADGTVAEKLLAYNRANREVAILCNHQRAVSKGHAGQMEKIQDKVKTNISLFLGGETFFFFFFGIPSTNIVSFFHSSIPFSVLTDSRAQVPKVQVEAHDLDAGAQVEEEAS